ncbi:MAG: hypothetical protein Barrevirus8_2 [Barrevirus sp.]|uniref:Uncharacterized protein n=1 Tax=Barrevirus sp. TaxID=2487763 RepID=A0A3G4ZQ50_9VIRU|nr:MAG: hypothetical protein Barrevirus8_2 [Barrevirus sp.]
MEFIHNNQIPFFTNKKINLLANNDIFIGAIKQIIGKRKVHY